MCERYSKRPKGGLAFFFGFSVLFVLVISGFAFAQGGDGRSGVVERSKPARKKTPKAARAIKRPAARTPAVKPPPLGRLSIFVNEGGTVLELTATGDERPKETISIGTRASSLIVRNLPEGIYTIRAIKPGYFEEVASVAVAGGKRRRINIVLRPMMATLSVRASLPDAQIEIGGLGRFNRPVMKMLVKPGKYSITVKRRGYVTQTLVADLPKAGDEKISNVVLQPMRIESVLDLASDNISKGNYAAAAQLAGDVLALNAAHARANLLFGLVEYRRGDSAANAYFLKAMRNGETVRLPVKLSGADGSYFAAELLIDRNGLGIRSSERFDQNFTIARPDVADLRQMSRETPYVVLSGRSDFHGRPISPTLEIHSPHVAGTTANTTCQALSGACRSDIDLLFQLLTSWRTLR